MRVSVNGEARDVPDGVTVHVLVCHLGLSPEEKGIAVAVNGEVVFRKDWGKTRLNPESRVEIVRAVAGG